MDGKMGAKKRRQKYTLDLEQYTQMLKSFLYTLLAWKENLSNRGLIL